MSLDLFLGVINNEKLFTVERRTQERDKRKGGTVEEKKTSEIKDSDRDRRKMSPLCPGEIFVKTLSSTTPSKPPGDSRQVTWN